MHSLQWQLRYFLAEPLVGFDEVSVLVIAPAGR